MLHDDIEKLHLFKDGKLTKNDINAILQSKAKIEPITITSDHLIHILQLYKQKIINKIQLIEWVNVIWFSDYFTYQEEQSSSIASVISEIETFDETNNEPTLDLINYYITCLNKNIEV